MAARYLTFALQLISSLYIAQKLGNYYWGIWSFILLLANVGNMLNWGIGNSINILLVQHKTESKLSAKYCYNGFILSCLIMIPAIAFTAYERLIGIPFFAKYHVGNYSVLILLIVCIGYLNNFFVNVFRVKNRLFAIAFFQSAFPFTCFLLMFFANGEKLLTLLMIGYFSAVSLALIIFLCGKYIDWHEQIDFKIMCCIFLKGLYLFFYNACFLMIALSTKTIISYYYPVESFGCFAFAFNLANATLLLVDSFTFIAFPKMINMLRAKETHIIVDRISFLRKCYLLCISGIVYLAIPGCWILLRFLPKYQSSFESFFIIVLALTLYPLCYGYNTFLLANNQEKKMAELVGIALLTNILLTYFAAGVLQLKMEFCAIGIMVVYFFFAVSIIFYARKRLCLNNRMKIFLDLFPLYSLVPFGIAFALFLFNKTSFIYTLIPLVVFLILATREVLFLKKFLLQFLNTPDILNIK